MKASTLFALTLALLLGLGAAAGARYAGLFDKKAPPAPEPPRPPAKVLIANMTMYEGVMVSVADVRVRDLSPEEMVHFEANKDKYMPAFQMAAHLRVPTRTIPANVPLLKEYFQEASLPEPLSSRLAPGFRAVHVEVPKAKAAGGVIQLNEYVDVYMTAKLCPGGDCKNPFVRTACIAQGCKVVMKRGILHTILQSDPDDKPVKFALEVNPYRAALIEYAGGQGQLALIPSQAPTKKGPPFANPGSKEYADEDLRVDALNRAELTVGANDLYRIFGLVLAPAPRPNAVVRIDGVTPSGVVTYPGTAANPSGTGPATAGMTPVPQGADVNQAGFTFKKDDPNECKNCGKAKEEPVVGR